MQLLLILFFFNFPLYANDVILKQDKTTPVFAPMKDVKQFLQEHNFYSRSNLDYLLGNKIIVNSEVETVKVKDQSQQKMVVNVAGIHGKNCQHSSAILSQYEKYSDYLSVLISKSAYHDGKVFLTIKIPIIGKEFLMDVKIDRLHGPGIYPYVMGAGIFQGLTGQVDLFDYSDDGKTQKCFYYIDAHWQGPDTGYPDSMVEAFTSTLGQRGLTGLFIISGHQPTN